MQDRDCLLGGVRLAEAELRVHQEPTHFRVACDAIDQYAVQHRKEVVRYTDVTVAARGVRGAAMPPMQRHDDLPRPLRLQLAAGPPNAVERHEPRARDRQIVLDAVTRRSS